MRHVVQVMQMNAIDRGEFNTLLSTYDLWVSVIENWEDAIRSTYTVAQMSS